MYNFEKNLIKVINILDGNISYFDPISKVYTFTTENVYEYLKYFELENKRLLTVGSSGDQILNSFYCGARDITLFDINEYSKYYLYLKISAILSLDYLEFQKFFFKHGYDINEDYYNKKMFSKDIFDKIKSTLRLLDYDSYLFYDEIFHMYQSERIRDYLFDDDECRNKVIRGFNIYLKNENTYNKLKKNLYKLSFKFINGDIFKDNISGKFDNIFLSNLCTWYKVEELKKLIEKLDNNINFGGSILIGYLYDTYFYDESYKEDWNKIYDIKNTREVLNEFISEHNNVKNSRCFIFDEENNKRDLVLIYRKK